jgi:hypothetical protein
VCKFSKKYIIWWIGRKYLFLLPNLSYFKYTMIRVTYFPVIIWNHSFQFALSTKIFTYYCLQILIKKILCFYQLNSISLQCTYLKEKHILTNFTKPFRCIMRANKAKTLGGFRIYHPSTNQCAIFGKLKCYLSAVGW